MAETKQSTTVVDSMRRIIVKKMNDEMVITTTYEQNVFSDESRTCSVTFKVVDGNTTYNGNIDYKHQCWSNMTRDIPMDDLAAWVMVTPDYMVTAGNVCAVTYYGPKNEYTKPLVVCAFKPDAAKAALTAKVTMLTEQLTTIKGEMANRVTSLNEQLTTIKGEMANRVTSLNEQLTTIKTNLVNQMALGERIMNAQVSAAQECEQLRAENADLTKQLADLKKTLADQVAAAAIAAETYAGVRDECQKLRTENMRLANLPRCTHFQL